MYQPKTIFPVTSLDRNLIKWEDYLYQSTPIENHDGVYYKLEQEFAPLGVGGPNGSKCRQLVWLMNRFKEGKTHVLSGASIQSPQLLMSAAIGAHYGLPSRLVVYSKPETVLNHSSPHIAAGFGAVFEYAAGPYNPIIQRKVLDLSRPDSLIVPYGITVPHETSAVEDVLQFHEVGAAQTQNIPDDVENLIMPAGSCNSICSVILGLSKDSKNLKKLFAVQIGPDKRKWLRERLSFMGVDMDKLPFKIVWHSLHDTKFATYSQHMPETVSGIEMHSVYEGKIVRYMKQNGWIKPDNKTLFWVVGGAPKVSTIKPFFNTEVNV